MNVDLGEKGLLWKAQNRAVWRRLVRNIDPHVEAGKDAVEEDGEVTA